MSADILIVSTESLLLLSGDAAEYPQMLTSSVRLVVVEGWGWCDCGDGLGLCVDFSGGYMNLHEG